MTDFSPDQWPRRPHLEEPGQPAEFIEDLKSPRSQVSLHQASRYYAQRGPHLPESIPHNHGREKERDEPAATENTKEGVETT